MKVCLILYYVSVMFKVLAGPHSSSPIPDFIPNTHPDEPSVAPEIEQLTKGLVQVGSLQVSDELISISDSPTKSPEPEHPVEIHRPRKVIASSDIVFGRPITHLLITGFNKTSQCRSASRDWAG
jgi:hypothetical protein